MIKKKKIKKKLISSKKKKVLNKKYTISQAFDNWSSSMSVGEMQDLF